MSALSGLGPFLDVSALFRITKHLLDARSRLHLRTGQNLPTAGQLAIALRLYILDQDRQRGERASVASHEPGSSGVVLNDHTGLASSGAEQVVDESSARQLSIELARRLRQADAAYSSTKDEACDRLACCGGPKALLESRWSSSQFHPAYFIAYDVETDSIVISIRGSMEISDFFTNLSIDTEEFLDGYGHSGIIKSAQNIAKVLSTRLPLYLAEFRPRNGIVVVGHSLGAAVASLLTIMLRMDTFAESAALGDEPPPQVLRSTWSRDTHPGESLLPVRRTSLHRLHRSHRTTSGQPAANASSSSTLSSTERSTSPPATPQVPAGRSIVPSSDPSLEPTAEPFSAPTSELPPESRCEMFSRYCKRARCYAFCPPPCVSSSVALLSRNHGILSVIHGFDLVPRLSAASLDRLLVAVSRYDWASDASRSVESTVSGIAAPMLGAAGAAAVASAVARAAPQGAAWVSSAVGQGARRALSASATRQGSASTAAAASRAPSTAWRVALAATAVASSVVSHQFFSQEPAHAIARANANPDARRQHDYSYARHFGMSPEDVERALLEEGPADLDLAGKILHLERRFTPPGEAVESQMATRHADDFGQGGVGDASGEAATYMFRFVYREAEYFRDVEASGWMITDHHPRTLETSLEYLL